MKTENKLLCQWHCLPTGKINRIGQVCKFSYGLNIPASPAIGYTAMELYLTSSEEIKKDNWYILSAQGVMIHRQPTEVHPLIGKMAGARKIIASTDKSLGLPTISQEDIEAYVKHQGEWKECYVEIGSLGYSHPTLPSLNSDGSVIIVPKEIPLFPIEDIDDMAKSFALHCWGREIPTELKEIELFFKYWAKQNIN